MIDRKKLLIIGIVAFIGFIFFVLIVISAFTTKEKVTQDTQPAPTSAELLIPTSSNSSNEDIVTEPTDNAIQLVSINPQDGSIDQSPALQVSITFSEPIKERAFYYKVDPSVPTLIHSDGNSIIITPKNIWTFGVNTITVYAESESLSGKRLSTPFTYSFTVKDLPEPDEGFEK